MIISLSFLNFRNSLETFPLSLGVNTQTLDLAFSMRKETKAPTIGGKKKCWEPCKTDLLGESHPHLLLSPPIFYLLSCAAG